MGLEVEEMVERRGAGKAATGRVHAFDNLRAFAMLLGIALHALIPFVTDPAAEMWPILNERRHPVFDAIVGVTHSFRMQLFFLIAGFFARLLAERRGWRAFYRNRVQRIGVPFVGGMATLVPLVCWQAGLEVGNWPTIHLWFLQYLIIYYAVSWGAVWIAGKIGARGANWGRRLAGSNWSVVVWTGITFALMWRWPVWDEERFGRGQYFWPHPAILAYYGLFFACGWLVHRHQRGIEWFRARAGVNMALGWASIAVWAVSIKMEQAAPGSVGTGLRVLSWVGGSAMSWLFSFSLLGYFLRWFDKGSAVGRYLADASYWMYLAHLPLIIGLQQWLIPGELSMWVKAGLINLIAFAVLIASYQFLVRGTFMGRLLNGPRAGRTQSSA